MPNYHIKTLTPLHVGSGEELLGNYRFVYFPNDKLIAILDERKVYEVIKEEHLEDWVRVLDKGESLLHYFQERRNLNIIPEDIASRIVPMIGTGPNLDNPNKHEPIREQIRSADRPMIPGSSIKGAIRTAILVLYLDEDEEDRWYERKDNLTNRRGRFEDKKVMQKLLGRDPNHDLFRLLRPADVSFDNTMCTVSLTLSMRGNDSWAFKEQIRNHVECIPAGEESTLKLSYAHNQVEISGKVMQGMRNKHGRPYKTYDPFKNRQVEDLDPEKKLFHFINEHTRILISNELEFWEEQRKYPPEVDTYLEKLKEIHDILQPWTDEKYTEKCILRLGWGTGFKNMTGDWQANKFTDDLFDQLKKDVRDRKYPLHLPLPKSRRMTWQGEPFGFVEISN